VRDELAPDPNDLVLSYPVFAIAEAKGRKKLGLLRSITTFSAAGFGKFLPLFTDVEVAKETIRDAGLRGKAPLEFQTPQALLAVLRDFQDAGCATVAFDFTVWASSPGRFYKISEILGVLGGN
jgi:hypothetical protein